MLAFCFENGKDCQIHYCCFPQILSSKNPYDLENNTRKKKHTGTKRYKTM
jgi:Ulp1 family protease